MALTVDDENMEVDDTSIFSDDDLPTSLIVVNVASSIFDNDESRRKFEEVFRSFEETATFQLFRNFHRIRVNYSMPSIAAAARIKLNEANICGNPVKCYFVQIFSQCTTWLNDADNGACRNFQHFCVMIIADVYLGNKKKVKTGDVSPAQTVNLCPSAPTASLSTISVMQSKSSRDSDPFLKPPIPEKQFLISPPASPPVGWEQPLESQPIINYDLLSAIAGLAPGCSHELHPESTEHPSIVVHLCNEDAPLKGERPTIIQTRCPTRSASDTDNT